ncbi:MAG: hypothetical protein GY705_12535, partial [Bacteroidetes bacterium]|nr:hypothetical protein [Bacteroidota bacterium]
MKRTTKANTIIAIAALGLLMSKNLNHRNDTSIYTATITGNTTLAGTDVLYDGLISPGHSPGKVNVTGNFTMGSGATYKCELKDLTGAGTGHDQIDVTGELSLDGILDIVLLDLFAPGINDVFEIIKFGTLNASKNTFTTVNWPASMSTN